ncbi:hypothetical protein ABPG75_014037 [Micractinium tetrahymenae]
MAEAVTPAVRPPPVKRKPAPPPPKKQSWAVVGCGPAARPNQSVKLAFASDNTAYLATYGQTKIKDLNVDLVLDAVNTPIMSYTECGTATHHIFGFTPAGGWQKPGPEAGLPLGLGYSKLALGPQGQLWLCFQEGGTFGASCMAFAGSQWVFAGQRGFTFWPIMGDVQPTLAIDSQNRPLLAYIADSGFSGVEKQQQAEVQRFNPAKQQWELLGLDSVTSIPAMAVSLALGQADTPYASVVDISGVASVFQLGGAGEWTRLGEPFAALPGVAAPPGQKLRAGTHIAFDGVAMRKPYVVSFSLMMVGQGQAPKGPLKGKGARGTGYGIRYRYGMFRQAVKDGLQTAHCGQPGQSAAAGRSLPAVPLLGYGIRYRYGMFRQAVKDGLQVELPDYWLDNGNPWEIRRPATQFKVGFYGSLQDGKWVPGEEVIAEAYDGPIPGYKTKTCSNLRLWDALPTTELDLQAFNAGDYVKAVEQKRKADEITAVLYPNDATEEGKELRLKQQFFFVSASLQDTIARYLEKHSDLSGLPEKACFQMNDTHPTIAVAELMRLLIHVHGLSYDDAWAITTKTVAYTNHTVMPEALEKWPVRVLAKLLPRHMHLIEEINDRWLASIKVDHVAEALKAYSIIQENQWNKGEMLVNMAYLAVVGSFAVNGVAAIHSEIIKTDIFPQFVELFPERFQNKTNGVTLRRWLAYCNPELSALITEALGTDAWVKDASLLEKLKPFAEDAGFRARWRAIKQQKKAALAAHIKEVTGYEVSTEPLFDIQVKRIHEYKRQFMNAISLIYRYKTIKEATPEERAKVGWFEQTDKKSLILEPFVLGCLPILLC